MNIHLDSEVYRFNQVFFQKKANKNYSQTTKQLKKIIKSFFIFNISFFSLFLVEIILFALLFSVFSSSVILALVLASMFLTSFTYLVLLFYFQSKKTEQLTNLKDHFIKVCKRALSIPIGSAEHHLTIALAALKLTDNLNENELLKLPKIVFKIFKKLESFLIKEDVFKFKESLLIAAILEHLNQLKITPTDLEVHTSLTNIYTSLFSLYKDAKNKIFFSKNQKEHLEQKYLSCIKIAIEEFRVLNDYAPNDPWIHLQLAKNYNRLDLKIDELKEYETIYKLCPKDNNILFKLGCLYFATKSNSKGLRVYEELKMRAFKDTDKLLDLYEVYKNFELLQENV